MCTHSMIYTGMQPARKQLAARRATAGLALANSREYNNADDCFLTGPKGAPQISQCRVAYSAYFWCSPCKGHAIPRGLRLALANLRSSASRDISLNEY
jgi:hypothetical protein